MSHRRLSSWKYSRTQSKIDSQKSEVLDESDMSLYHQMLDDIKNPENELQGKWNKIKKKIKVDNFKKTPKKQKASHQNSRKLPPRRVMLKRDKFKKGNLHTDFDRERVNEEKVLKFNGKRKIKKYSHTKNMNSDQRELDYYNIRYSQKTNSMKQNSITNNFIPEKLPQKLNFANFASNKEIVDSDRFYNRKRSVKRKKKSSKKIKSKRKIFDPSDKKDKDKVLGKDLFFKKMNINGNTSNYTKKSVNNNSNEKDFKQWIKGPNKFEGANSHALLNNYASATDNRVPKLNSKPFGKYVGESMDRRIINIKKKAKLSLFKENQINEIEESQVVNGIGRKSLIL